MRSSELFSFRHTNAPDLPFLDMGKHGGWLLIIKRKSVPPVDRGNLTWFERDHLSIVMIDTMGAKLALERIPESLRQKAAPIGRLNTKMHVHASRRTAYSFAPAAEQQPVQKTPSFAPSSPKKLPRSSRQTAAHPLTTCRIRYFIPMAAVR